MNRKKKAILFFLLIVLISTSGALTYYRIFYKPHPKQDNRLLEPNIILNSSDKKINNLSENNLNAILMSIKDSENELPSSSILPEFTSEQTRPSRSLIKSAIIEAEKVLVQKQSGTDDYLLNNLNTFDLAFKETSNPQYLDYVLDSISSKIKLSVEEVLGILKLITNQKKAIAYVNSQNYVSFMIKAIDTLKENCQKTLDPITAIKLYQCSELLPKKVEKSDFEGKLKIVLEDAYRHKNATRSDGLFLSSDESTEFSLQLINSGWQYYLDRKEIPKWLFQLAEKESCRLAFRLEPDGCLPDWSGKNRRNSLTSEIYKAAVVFDRDDLRFIAYGGIRMQDATPPAIRNYNFPEIGEAITRTNWNIYHFSNPIQNNYLGFREECFQVTYNTTYKKFSIYAATAHLGILENDAKSKEDKVILQNNSLQINDIVVEVAKEDIMYKINFKNSTGMKFSQMGRMYQLQDEKIVFYNRSQYLNDWTRYKPLWSCKVNKDNGFSLVFESAWKNKLMRR